MSGSSAPLGARTSHLISHSSLSVLTTAVDAAGALVVSILIGRLLGERPTGQYGYAQARAGIVLSVCALGLPSYVILSVAGASKRWSRALRSCSGARVRS